MLIHFNRLGLVVVTCAIALSCGANEQSDGPVLRPVLTHEVGYGGSATIRTFSGTAETGRIINLSLRSGGIITAFNISLGQSVRRGELLAQLDDVQARLAYEQSVTSLNSAASQLNTARLNLDRTRALYEEGSASLRDYENARNSFRTAEASHESAQRSVEIQQDQIGYGYLYAPESGTIGAIMAEVNENVGAGQTVAVLNAGTSMEIVLGLPETVINRVERTAEVDVTFTALTDATYRGRVTEVSPSVDANTSTFPVRITLIDPSVEIRSGMAANVTFDFGTQRNDSGSVVVPAKAVGEDGEGPFVFLIDQSVGMTATVRKQRVTLGALTSEGFEIRDGLRIGQVIATAGLQTLLDGQEVRLPERTDPQ